MSVCESFNSLAELLKDKTDEEILDFSAKQLRRSLNTTVEYGYDAKEDRYFFYVPKYEKSINFLSKFLRDRRYDVLNRAMMILEIEVIHAQEEGRPVLDYDKLKGIFEAADAEMSECLKIKTDGKITDLSRCGRDWKGTPVYDDTLMSRCRRHGFYCWTELDGKEYGASYNGLGVLKHEEYAEILQMFRDKYPIKTIKNKS